jgi:hypothetical protein
MNLACQSSQDSIVKQKIDPKNTHKNKKNILPSIWYNLVTIDNNSCRIDSIL